jgi:glucose 1-dehydrogenase
MKLQGQVAFVTGASAGIGKATVLALAQQGADVAMNYFSYHQDAEAVAEQVRRMGRRALLFPVDVSDQAAVEKMVAQTVAQLGRLNVLVSNAVYSDRDFFYQADMAGFKRTIDVTMWGAFNAVRAAAQQMIQQGQGGNIVVVSSPHAYIPFPSAMAYNMAKAALDQMSKTAALELIKFRIRVNIVHPGWTDTPGERKFFSEDVLQRAAAQLPWGRLCRPDEIARGIVFLGDPDSDYITGSTLAIDGGAVLPWWSKRGTGEF